MPGRNFFFKIPLVRR